MRSSTTSRVFIALGLLVPVILTQTAMAQVGPFGYDHGYGGAWGAAAYGASVSRANTQSRIAAERHSQAQSRAVNQNMVVQQGIRSTLAGSAQSRTQAARSEQQGARDWWFQHQLQASRTPRQPVSPSVAGAPQRTGASGRSTSESPDGKGTADVINWPYVLRGPRFAEQRARVESPYRDQTPDTGPTAQDYREMVDAAAQMGTILKGMSRSIPPIDFQQAQNFLDNLTVDARARAKRKAAEPAKRPATPGKKSE